MSMIKTVSSLFVLFGVAVMLTPGDKTKKPETRNVISNSNPNSNLNPNLQCEVFRGASRYRDDCIINGLDSAKALEARDDAAWERRQEADRKEIIRQLTQGSQDCTKALRVLQPSASSC